MSSDRKIDYLILTYLSSLKTESNSENIDVACQCIATALGLDISSTAEFQEHSYFPTDLGEIVGAGVKSIGAVTYKESLQQLQQDPKFVAFVDTCTRKGYFNGVDLNSLEYIQRNAKLMKKFREKTASQPSVAAPSAAPAELKQNSEQAAEEKKQAGNAAIQKKDYELAVQLYSEAIQLSPSGPNSHIYYANRSAAYCHLADYTQAISDAEASIRLFPTYAKAYSRLGLAHFSLGNYKAAETVYQTVVDLEPGNKAAVEALQQAQQRLQQTEAGAVAQPAPMGLPGLSPSALSSMMGMLGGAGGGGGNFMQMAQQMMQDPAFMQQAQQMMQNPMFMQQAQQMMQDPGAMQRALGALGGGGGGAGMPDMSQIAGLMNSIGAGASGGDGSTPGVPSFSGFQDN